MNSNDHRWLFLELSEGERLYRVRMSESGSVTLPEIGAIQIMRSSNGECSFRSKQGEIRGNLFSDGDVLTRATPASAPKGARASRAQKFPMVLAAAILTMIVFRFFPNTPSVARASEDTKPAPVSTPVKEEMEKPLPTSTPTATPTATPTSVPTPQPTPKDEIPKSTQKKHVEANHATPKSPVRWDTAESEARTAFLRGDWAKAESALAGLPMEKSLGTPDRVRALAGEIHYAKCQRFFAAEKWQNATQSCERAVGIYRNKRAYALLRQLSERARRLYLEGYVMEGTNREAAIQRFREVLEVAPSKDPFRAKAAKKLKVIEPHTED